MTARRLLPPAHAARPRRHREAARARFNCRHRMCAARLACRQQDRSGRLWGTFNVHAGRHPDGIVGPFTVRALAAEG